MTAARSLLSLVALLAAAGSVRAQDLKALADEFTAQKIVPDVLASFEPTLAVELTFDHDGFKIPIVPGVLLTINQTAAEPQIALRTSTNVEGTGYLVAMVDPDAPTPADRSVSQVRHFLAANYVAGPAQDGVHVLTSSTAPVGKYAGPGPAAPSDPHRYTFVVYEQPRAAIQAPTGENNAPFLRFNLGEYIAKVDGLKLVGATFFLVGPPGTVPTNTTAPPPTDTTTTGGASTPTETGGNGAATLKVGAAVVGAALLAFVL
ncbi:PEBP-like protein [Auricularia subglabra TFB-10046 SS5]|nr:PEBP-like protein [Auricularia subglabra TFB-10046 SS5]